MSTIVMAPQGRITETPQLIFGPVTDENETQRQVRITAQMAQGLMDEWGVTEAIGLGRPDAEIEDGMHYTYTARPWSMLPGEAPVFNQRIEAVYATLGGRVVAGEIVRIDNRHLPWRKPLFRLREYISDARVSGQLDLAMDVGHYRE